MPVEFKQKTLSNGLTIIAEGDGDAHSSAAGFFIKTGARDESPELMGVSHYLEHMMFKGSDSISAEEINQRFDALGARNNAYTTHEVTCYYAQVLPEKLAPTIDLLGTMLRPALRTDDFDTEKSVIIEEIAMYKDNPFWVLYEECCDRHYVKHPLGHRVLGTEDTVGRLSAEQMRAYFDNRYSADNTTLALAGRVDFDAVCDQVEQLCGGWQRTGASRDSAKPNLGSPDFVVRDERINRAYLLMLADAPAIDDDRRYAAQLLAQILGEPGNSRLHWALIETGIAEEAQAAFDPHDGVGQYFVYASGDPERADEIWAAAEKEIKSLPDAVTEDELERLRAKLATAVMLGGERPSDRMQRLGRLWTYLGRYTTLDEELERINAVTVDDVKEVYGAFAFEPRTFGKLLP